MSDPVLSKIDARIQLLREECWREIHEHADAKPAYALLRVYSKLKMFCEFYDGLRKGGGNEHDGRDMGASPSGLRCQQQGAPAQAGGEDHAEI